MPTIQVSTGELFRAVEQLGPEELKQFVTQVLSLQARRSPAADVREEQLLEQVRRGVPDETVRRYDELVAKRRAETLSPEEHGELLRLTDEVERWGVERVRAVVELAALRGVPPDRQMQELGVRAALPSENDAR